MRTLILPVAGASSRFPGMRPKWLLTMPDGSLMIETSVAKLNLTNIDQIVIIALQQHLDRYISATVLEDIFYARFQKNTIIVSLDEPTNGQAETVSVGISKANIDGPILIKDCDNQFCMCWDGNNSIGVLDLNNTQLINAANKSYIKLDDHQNVVDIVEKNVISNLFCVGAYGFESALEFLDVANRLLHEYSHEVYTSHVIFDMLLNGNVFKPNTIHDYLDFGTLAEYRSVQTSTSTIFCDVDGVLLENGSKFGPSGWRTKPIEKNINALKSKLVSKDSFLIITTSRPETEKGYISEILASYDVYPDHWVFNLPHCKRLLINDFSRTNPFPSAIAVNLPRNTSDLDQYLDNA